MLKPILILSENQVLDRELCNTSSLIIAVYQNFVGYFLQDFTESFDCILTM